jgi:hypothetical protein
MAAFGLAQNEVPYILYSFKSSWYIFVHQHVLADVVSVANRSESETPFKLHKGELRAGGSNGTMHGAVNC